MILLDNTISIDDDTITIVDGNRTYEDVNIKNNNKKNNNTSIIKTI